MTEPIYNYVKGVGWSPNNYETHVCEIGRWRITLIKRPPEPGERYIPGYTPEVFFEAIKRNSPDLFERTDEIGFGFVHLESVGIITHNNLMYTLTEEYIG